MCKSQAQGGQRCAAHTKKALEAALAAYAADPTPDTFDRVQAARAEYASTPNGGVALRYEREKAKREGREADHADLVAALARGEQIRARNLAMVNEVGAASPSSAERAAALRRMKSEPWAESNPNNLTDATLVRLARDPEDLVRMELARYKGRLPAEATEILAVDPSSQVKDTAARRSDLSPTALSALGSDSDPKIRRATLMACHGGGSWAYRDRAYVLDKLNGSDGSVRAAAVEHWRNMGIRSWPGRPRWEVPPAEVVDRLLADRSVKIREVAKRIFVDLPAHWAAEAAS